MVANYSYISKVNKVARIYYEMLNIKNKQTLFCNISANILILLLDDFTNLQFMGVNLECIFSIFTVILMFICCEHHHLLYYLYGGE